MTDTLELSWPEKLIRCYFGAAEVLLDRTLMQYVLLDSWRRFRGEKAAYPFVRPGELKPGGMGEVGEYAHHNSALVMLLEHELLPELQTNIRARRPQEVVKKNLQRYLLRSGQSLEKIALMRDLETAAAASSLTPLLAFDYGLLIQRRSAGKKSLLNYVLTHFHVKIDEVLDRAIESCGLRLRYLSKNLYERGEDYADMLEEKYDELYGMKSTAAGRRTAAVVGHTLLIENPGQHVVYVGSTEARSLIKIRENDHVTRMCLVELDDDLLAELTKAHGLSKETLREHYCIPESDPGVGVLAVHYQPSSHGSPPADRKVRTEIRTSERWITVDRQLLVPLSKSMEARPLALNWIYRTKG